MSRTRASFGAVVAALTCAAALFGVDAIADDNALLDGRASYPEGPLFVGSTLYVAEMGADRVSAYANGAKRTFFRSPGCGPTALAPYRDGFLILCHLAGEVVAVDRAGAEIQRYGKGVLRDPNDGYADPLGGVYFSDPGVFSKESRRDGAVFRLDPQGRLQRVAAGLWYPNGVYVDTHERAVYVSATFERKVWRYAMGADGALSDKTLFADIDAIAPRAKFAYREAGPDGLERDPATGEMIIAIYGEGRLLRITPDGKLAGQIQTPAQYQTNVAFGAPGAVVVGSYDNVNPPLTGEVRWWKRAR